MKQETSFPNLLDSLYLYKEAILSSLYNEDLETVNINFARLISVLEYHNRKEKRLDKELEEAKRRYLIFQKDMKGKIFHKARFHFLNKRTVTIPVNYA